jgi:calcineurin-like phosphoesterase family protein
MDYFTSDLHLGHQAILEYTQRGYYLKGADRNIAIHDQWVIDRINTHVKPTDTLWIIGDVTTYKRYEALQLIEKINGHKHLVMGNHDKGNETVFTNAKDVFESVQWYKELHLNKKKIILFHNPIAEWDSGHYSSWHLHGHCHGGFNYEKADLHDKRILDVGWDNSIKLLGEYRPFSYERIADYMDGRVSIEHHGKAD